MNGTGNRPISSGLVGLAAGIVTLVLVTALLAAAVYSFSANGQIDRLVTANQSLNSQLADLRRSDDQSVQRSTQAQQDRDHLMDQNKALHGALVSYQQQVAALIHFLRAHGIDVPQDALLSPIPSAPKPRKRAPSPHPQPSPSPSPSPTPKPNGICALVPLVCPRSKVVSRESLVSPRSEASSRSPFSQGPEVRHGRGPQRRHAHAVQRRHERGRGLGRRLESALSRRPRS